MSIELIIVHREPPPFTELGRMRRIEKYNSLRELCENTLNDDYIHSHKFEFLHCTFYIVLLMDGIKYRYSSYEEYKKHIINL
jgi:hypothetical protein